MISSASPVGLFGSVYHNRNSNSVINMQQQSSASGSSPFATYSSSSSSPQMGLDVEFGADPASGAFFQNEGRKHDDLKQMLDSNKDGLKLEAMKRIIGMIARGRDASDLFPAVVKNVVSKNIEVKKLVYVYLVRYAEEQQDLALLSISTFQRALKDPNQLIRASALRVLSSIRVSMIVPIVMLAIRDSAMDMSPYVRKTAAHAIPKLYSLDAEQKDELVTVIEKLLSDRTTLVVGSAVMAFDEVCPERVDLIHKNYRKLCNLLVDVDEWGQVIIINMLTRYARTQFVDPNADEPVESELKEKPDGATGENFYEESSTGDSSDASGKEKHKKSKRKAKSDTTKERTYSSSSSYHVDLDHRLLLRQTKPLLQSRNASVVMAVAQLYHHVAPRNEVQLIAKALIRLLRSHKEVQSVVLTCIASMSTKRKGIFEPHIKSFFVRTSDPTHIKLLKLDILTNLASASTIALILREFQTYISSSDRSFVAATIQAIGRCAASIKEVTETCLSGLVHLLSNRDEHVVAESVVVIKNLLQSKSAEHYEIISQMAKLIDYITIPAARASILWLIGEYNEKVPKIAPDVLRKIAKTFVDEEDVVKLQILNLGVKLFLTNPQQTSLLSQYVFTLARYDPNYDVRDRARFLRQFIFPANGRTTVLAQNARKIFLSSKPKPALESKYRERDHFQLGSLSHYLNMRATGYKDLPPFPTEALDASVRNIEGYMQESSTANAGAAGGAASGAATRTPQKQSNKNAHTPNDKNFFSESEKSSDYSESESSSSSSSSSSSDGESSESETDQVNDAAAANANRKSIADERKSVTTTVLVNAAASNGNNNVHLNVNNNGNKDTGTSDSESSSYGSSESSTDSGSGTEDGSESSESETESEKQRKFQRVKEKAKEAKAKEKENTTVVDATATAAPSKMNLDLLLDLDDIPPVGPVMTPSLGGFLTPATPLGGAVGLLPVNAANRIELVGPSHIEFKHRELLNKLSGHGLQVSYRFTRAPHLYSSAMVSIELQFVNLSNTEITNIHLSQQTLPTGMNLNEFAPMQCLQPQQMSTSVLGIDFNDSTHAVELEITTSAGKSRVTLKPPVGELVRSVQITESYFNEERTKLRGMNEHQSRLQLRRDAVDLVALKQRIFETINVAHIAGNEANNNLLYFVGQTMNSRSLVLITLDWQVAQGEQLALIVNCEKMVIGSMVLNELRNALSLAFQC
ncbi:AP-3 complex subunit beta-2 [Anastrepha ludens]|uniref:AP-3 complex subunit beta-2 n=1 Tax=Anastrepha ludens TaxID=28586 RepID=UPI0023AFFBC6|nr:AP-3 complex subunit beta-2 [Anastrepha ludens]